MSKIAKALIKTHFIIITINFESNHMLSSKRKIRQYKKDVIILHINEYKWYIRPKKYP